MLFVADWLEIGEFCKTTEINFWYQQYRKCGTETICPETTTGPVTTQVTEIIDANTTEPELPEPEIPDAINVAVNDLENDVETITESSIAQNEATPAPTVTSESLWWVEIFDRQTGYIDVVAFGDSFWMLVIKFRYWWHLLIVASRRLC